MELSKDQIIQELIVLLNQNQQKEAANNVFEMTALIDGMGKRLEQVTEELVSVRKQLEKMEQEKANKTLKATVCKAVDSLEQQCQKMKKQLFEIKIEVKAKASEVVAETKAKGKAALHKVSEFLGVKDKLESVRDNIRKSIGETEQTMIKLDAFGSGMREAGQKIANTFRTFADKETVDYSVKEKHFSKTELAKKPFAMQKKLYESMERYLDAAIDKVKSLAKQPELVQEVDMAEPTVLGMVAEQEFQYGAEVFEAREQEISARMTEVIENKDIAVISDKSR
ncbi:DUF6674 family protein [Mediterraneibacter agrestimuris]|uniref:DUF6674 family protein n=1 Tax=Mediterraneibacter agrestimuris TaxID=2941333 RepID=UPI00203A53EC|nr:DUF6674 family protein [Mediterraneibacter agrestimuris]